MRYLVLSDIHANQIAFEAVLRHAKRQRWEKVLFLGDIVGYYPEPEAATRTLRDLQAEVLILGNHDHLLLELFHNPNAISVQSRSLVLEVLERHLHCLSGESLGFLQTFQLRVQHDTWEAVHGAPRDPWEYLGSLQSAQANLPLLRTDLCLVGHTHVPMVYACVQTEKGDLWRTVPFRGERAVYRLPPKAKVFFNPGSVGQPRDGMPLASYAIFDDALRVIELFRVPFDLIAVQRQVRQHGYPEALAARLEVGR
jgi:predicted phosphodiesterase